MKKRFIAFAAVAGIAAAFAVPAHSASTKSISLKDNFFSPSSATIRKGTTVRWRWTGKAPHNVTVTRGPVKFHSSVQRSGTYSKRMTHRGTYRIVCTIHPGMGMTLRVK